MISLFVLILMLNRFVCRKKTAYITVCTSVLNCIESFFVTAAVLYSRCTCIDTRHAQKACRKWSLEMDVALVQYINRLCRHLAITPARLHPHEVYLDPSDIADPRVACLLSKYTCAFFLSYVLTSHRSVTGFKVYRVLKRSRFHKLYYFFRHTVPLV